MQYSDFITTVTTLLEVPLTNAATAAPSSDPNFNNLIVPCINYVEQKLQQDMDLIQSIVRDPNGTSSANSRTVSLPTDFGTFVVVQGVALIIGGVRQAPLTPVSRDFLDAVYPSETAASTPSYPSYWAPYNGTQILVGPPTDAVYPVEIVGTQRCNQLSATNTSNFLSLNFSDLYTAAAMIYLSAYKRDYGAMSSDPAMAVSWTSIYEDRLKAYDREDLRKKFQSAAATYRNPNPLMVQT